MQVGGVAVIATTSALLAKPLADLLLKAVRPAIKIMKKIAAIRVETSYFVVRGTASRSTSMNHDEGITVCVSETEEEIAWACGCMSWRIVY